MEWIYNGCRWANSRLSRKCSLAPGAHRRGPTFCLILFCAVQCSSSAGQWGASRRGGRHPALLIHCLHPPCPIAQSSQPPSLVRFNAAKRNVIQRPADTAAAALQRWSLRTRQSLPLPCRCSGSPSPEQPSLRCSSSCPPVPKQEQTAICLQPQPQQHRCHPPRHHQHQQCCHFQPATKHSQPQT